MKTSKLLIGLAIAFIDFSALSFHSCSTGNTSTGSDTEMETGTTGGEMISDTVPTNIEMEEGSGTGNQDDDMGTGTGTNPDTKGAEGMDTINEVK